MYTTEYGLAGTAVALLSLLSVPLYSHLRTSIIPWTRPVLDNNVGGLARRVVVIVSDGLRADQPLDKLSNGLGYKSIIKTTSWVEAPTESRPAHAQFLCGVSEDPQAIFDQWTRFPRTPDNVLRNAQFAVAIGAPDVVPFFGGRNVHMETFPQSFYSQEGRQLDDWTVSKLKDLLQHGQENEKMAAKLATQGTIFFLHLAGVDTVGHRYGSQSSQYLIHTKLYRYSDAVLHAQTAVLNIVNSIEDYFKDKETAFIFLSDHGFGAAKSHDDAETSSRRTPLWLFGKGFNTTVADGTLPHTNHKDISLLISILSGNPLPTDSIGIVPIHLLQVSDFFKANAILLACQSSLIRMRTVYNQLIEHGDRLLGWSSTKRDMDTMSRNFEQLQLIIESKPELAKEIVNMAQAAHKDIIIKTDSLIYRNSGIAVGLAIVTVLMAAVSMLTVGYQNVKGSGETGAFSFLSLLVASAVSAGLALRGADWPYHVWCWAAAVVFALNGAVMSIDGKQLFKRDSLAVLAVTLLTTLSLFFPPTVFIGLAAFTAYTIVVCRREQKRSMYGLVAILMTIALAVLSITPTVDQKMINLIVKIGAISSSFMFTKASFGDVTIGQVALCGFGIAADFLEFSTLLRVIVSVSLIAHSLDNASPPIRWFWTCLTIICCCGSAHNIILLLAVALGAVLLNRVHLQEHLGDFKFEPFINSIPALFIMAAFIVNGSFNALFKPYAHYSLHFFNNPAVGTIISVLMTILPSIIIITTVKSGHYSKDQPIDDSRFRVAAAMMMPFAVSALFSLLTMEITDKTWSQVGESIGRYEFSIMTCALIFLTGYL